MGRKGTVSEIEATLKKAFSGEDSMFGLIDGMRCFVDNDSEVEVHHHPARTYTDGKTTGKLWLDFEYAINEATTADNEDTLPKERRLWACGDNVITYEVREIPLQDMVSVQRAVVIIHVKDGFICGYDAYYDPQDPSMLKGLLAMEAKVRETIPMPNQEDIAFEGEPVVDLETRVKIYAALMDGLHTNGFTGMLDSISDHAHDFIDVKHHPEEKGNDGYMEKSSWIKSERNMFSTYAAENVNYEVSCELLPVGNFIIIDALHKLHSNNCDTYAYRTLHVIALNNGKISGYEVYSDLLPKKLPAAQKN